jgi:hypothetical protein
LTGPSAASTSPAPPTGPDTTAIPGLSSLGEAAASELGTRDFDVGIPTSEKCCHLTITNGPPTAAGLTICENGTADWQAHCPGGNPHHWKQIAGVTLDILHADEWPSDPSRLAAYPHLNLLGRIALAATAHDLHIAFDSPDPANPDFLIHDELTVTNPAQPHRGTVRITSHGVLRWRCRIRHQPHGTDGLYLSQITTTITRALTSTQIAQHSKQPAPATP